MDEGKRLGSAGDFMHVCHELTPVPSWNQVTKRLWPFRGWKREQSKATRGRTPWKKTKEDCQSASGGTGGPSGTCLPGALDLGSTALGAQACSGIDPPGRSLLKCTLVIWGLVSRLVYTRVSGHPSL